MGVIHQQPGVFFLGRSAERWQVGQIAVHAEHTIGNHQGVAAGLVQPTGEARRIVVQITGEPRAAEQAGIQQGSVIDPVFQHCIATPDQRCDGGQVGHITGGKQQGARAAGELGQRLFQLMVRAAVTYHQMGSAATDAPLGRTLLHGGDHLRVTGQPQIIIRAKGQQRLTIDQYQRRLRALQLRALAIQMGGTAFAEASGEIEAHGHSWWRCFYPPN